MMKFLLGMVFMIPLCFLNCFWFVQFVFFSLTFLFMLSFSFDYSFNYISYLLGCDLLSYTLVLLSFWICSLMILASEKVFKMTAYSNFFCFVLVILMISLYLTFVSLNLFVFYLFFEISLVPTLLLIIGWGYQPERIEAGVYLLFYTLFVSLPMMIAIFYCYGVFNQLSFFFLSVDLNNVYLYFCMIMVFLVKIPMFMIHLWLPKAHVEAPVAGSMILAGIMLKLGGYGLLRLMPLFSSIGLSLNHFLVTVSLMGGFFISLVCLRQSDMKALIAYSSVSHMSLVVSGIFTLNSWGGWGSLVMMLAHGLCSSGLFCLTNIVYERLGSRSLYLSKGLMSIMPSLTLWWFLLSSSNMAAPPSLNLLGEILLINSLISYSWMLMILLSLMSFFSAAYSLFLYSFSQHGSFYSGMFSVYQGSPREFLLLLLHWVPLNILILGADHLSLWI
nr:NADH dehydrogenase subunit 4 [Pyrrhidium sanguineum]